MFQLEINKLIDCNFDMLQQLGKLIYNRENQDGGLTVNELDELLRIVTVEEMDKEYQEAYDQGFNNGC